LKGGQNARQKRVLYQLNRFKNERRVEMPVFIVFEGLDGAGKTTLSKALASDLNALYIATPPPLLGAKIIRNIMDEQASLKTRFLYYLLANSFVSDKIREARRSRDVVCDRYIHSTLVIHQLLEVGVTINLNSLRLEQPDISFFIFTSDEDERRRRIENRGKKTKYDIMKEDKVFRRRYIDYFQRKPEFIFIDTSHENEEGSLERIKAEILKRRPT